MTIPIDRRAFLKTAAAVVASAPLPAKTGEKTVLRIIDTHQHLWDLKRFQLPWLKNVAALNKSYLMEDYLQATAALEKSAPPARVVRSIYMEVDVAPQQQQAEADWVVGVCKRGGTPMVAGVVSGRPASDDFARYAQQFKGSPYIKGIRQVLHVPQTPATYCLDRKFIAGIRLLGELGLSFDLCMRPAELPDATRLIDACPDTRFILDHCGNTDIKAKDRSQWKKDIAEVARRKNVVCKVSGIVASAPPGKWTADDLAPIVNHTLDVFGPDRVMFGGDWPVCTLAATYSQWVEALRAIVRNRKEEEQRKLFHDNAVRVYQLT
jgi:predicted TIM-barrel fold metal-dependent hydrolase